MKRSAFSCSVASIAGVQEDSYTLLRKFTIAGLSCSVLSSKTISDVSRRGWASGGSFRGLPSVCTWHQVCLPPSYAPIPPHASNWKPPYAIYQEGIVLVSTHKHRARPFPRLNADRCRLREMLGMEQGEGRGERGEEEEMGVYPPRRDKNLRSEIAGYPHHSRTSSKLKFLRIFQFPGSHDWDGYGVGRRGGGGRGRCSLSP